MFDPRYEITPKILGNVKKIGILVEKLNRQKTSAIIFADMKKDAVSLSSHSSTEIEGNPLSLAEVRDLLAKPIKKIDESEREVLNYNNALKKLNKAISKKDLVLNLTTILSIQKEVVQGLIESKYCGKLRSGNVYVKNNQIGKVVYMAPDAKDVRKLLTDLIKYIDSSLGMIDPVVLAGIFHRQFVIIHPFADGNGRTTRLVTKAILAKMGLDTFHIFSFENYYAKNKEEYFKHVGAIGHYYDIADKIDFSDWLEYFTDGIINELVRVEREIIKRQLSPENELKEYHKKLIGYIEKHGYITDREYSKLTDRAKPTRNLDFRKLIKMGLIKKQGKGINTYYKER